MDDIKTTIQIGDKITVHADGIEKTGEVLAIWHMIEKDDVWINTENNKSVIVFVHPGTKKKDQKDG